MGIVFLLSRQTYKDLAKYCTLLGRQGIVGRHLGGSLVFAGEKKRRDEMRKRRLDSARVAGLAFASGQELSVGGSERVVRRPRKADRIWRRTECVWRRWRGTARSHAWRLRRRRRQQQQIRTRGTSRDSEIQKGRNSHTKTQQHSLDERMKETAPQPQAEHTVNAGKEKKTKWAMKEEGRKRRRTKSKRKNTRAAKAWCLRLVTIEWVCLIPKQVSHQQIMYSSWVFMVETQWSRVYALSQLAIKLDTYRVNTALAAHNESLVKCSFCIVEQTSIIKTQQIDVWLIYNVDQLEGSFNFLASTQNFIVCELVIIRSTLCQNSR